MADNMHMETGTPLSPLDVKGTRYSFENLNFSDFQVIQLPEGVSLNDNSKMLSEQYFPSNISAMLCFEKVGCQNYKVKYRGDVHNVVANYDELSDMDSCFITPAGTLCPQIVYPINLGFNAIKAGSHKHKI